MSAAPFLNVVSSLTGRRWLARLDEPMQREALAIAQVHGLRDSLARVLAGRGVVVADLPEFLEPTLRNLMPDPSTVQDMDAAVARLVQAIDKREAVAIFGDYDVDGACSAALLKLYLQAFDVPVYVHIPDRITEGYGPNIPAIQALAEEGATLLVTVDCGISSHEALAAAADAGLDTIILDHHLAGETLPAAIAAVNPNRQDDLSGLGQLAACGVVYMTLVALNRALRASGRRLPDLMSMLDIVALGTVADVVPLKGLNRAFVRQGMKVLRQRERVGLAALMDAAGLKEPPEAWHMGFLLGPRINAGGRIGDAALGSRLLTTTDALEAQHMAGELDRLNRERQTIESIMVTEAEGMADAQEVAHGRRALVVTSSPDWHPGVIGLVASRLKERFQRPALAIAWDNETGQGVGSARSVQGVDLGRAVRAAVEAGLLIKGGGHAMAAGLSLRPEQLEPLQAFMEARLSEAVEAADESAGLSIDAALTASAMTPELVEEISRAGPFGQGHPEPIFVLPAHQLTDVMPVGQDHMRIRFRDSGGATGEGIAFRAQRQPLGDALMHHKGKTVHLAGTLKVDRWGGRERVDLRLMDVAAVVSPALR
jgi:single-stranded-DNA-specific exonuclease